MKQRFLITLSVLFLVISLAACERTPRSTIAGATTTVAITATQIQVMETDYAIASSVTTFLPGTAYHFVIVNNGKMMHEFMIMPKAEGNMSAMPMGNMDKESLASISDLNPGETRTLDYTFPPSTAGSHPELACYLPGHYEAGMKQDLMVK